MQKLRTMLDRVIMIVCVFLFVLMTIVGTYQISARYFFNSPSTISEELITYSFTWLSILAAAYVFGTRGHLCMTFLYSKFSRKNQVILDMLSESAVLLTSIILLIFGGSVMMIDNMGQITASLGVNMGVIYAVLPLAGIITCLYGLMNLCECLRRLKDVEQNSEAAA